MWTQVLLLSLLCGTGVIGYYNYQTVYMSGNCGLPISLSESGYISWSYSGHYGDNEDCSVVFYASSPGTVISLQFPEVDIESCVDHLYIYNGEYYTSPFGAASEDVCNNNIPSEFISTGNYITLRLTSDGSVGGTFRVLYTQYLTTSTASGDSSRIRLVDGTSPNEGRVEVRLSGSSDWGTVCDDGFDINDAAVACMTLGYPGASDVRPSAGFGQGSGSIYMDEVACTGTENSLFDCSYAGWGNNNCGHDEDVGVVCYTYTADSSRIRLVDGTGPNEGRVEVRLSGSSDWGTVCDDGFDINDAAVACRTLGYVGATDFRPSAGFGQGSGSIYMDNLACAGTENSLFDCLYAGWGNNNCGHGEDVGVVCYTSSLDPSTCSADHFHCSNGYCISSALQCDAVNNCPDGGDENCAARLRLVDGSAANEGRLEVRPEDSYSWGTVCDDQFDISDATVACRMLGYSEATEVRSSAHFGRGSGDIYMDDLQCSGDETSLFSCAYAGWGVHNCGHSEDVGIVCSSGGLSVGEIIGIVVGVLAGIVVLTVIGHKCNKSSSNTSPSSRVQPNMVLTNNTVVQRPTTVTQNPPAVAPQPQPAPLTQAPLPPISTVNQPYPPSQQFPPPPAYSAALAMPTQPTGGTTPYPAPSPDQDPAYAPPQGAQPPPSVLYPPADPSVPPAPHYLPPLTNAPQLPSPY